MKIAHDKITHAACGLLIAAIAATIIAHATAGHPLPAILGGVFTAVAAGIGKEIADWQHGAGFDWADIGSTAAGGAIGSLVGFAALAI